MKCRQFHWNSGTGWSGLAAPLSGAGVVLIFGSPEALRSGALDELRRHYPGAHLFGCSTAGEILDTRVHDDTLVATAIRFDSTRVEAHGVDIAGLEDSLAAGRRLAAAIDPKELVHVFVLSDGVTVNGTDLVRGLTAGLPPGVTVTGGLSGDGAHFRETLVLDEGSPRPARISALAFHGAALHIGCGSLGGWDSFGPERLVTRSLGNVVHELDGRSALDLYKHYLGQHAAGLPATGLLFPLSVRTEGSSTPVVRTILAVCEKDGSLTFAGDVPQGSHARLMKANFNRLIDGAHGAADACRRNTLSRHPDLAILISCVGRKLVLKQRVEEEVEAVRDVLGPDTALTGFYSYGEISPFTPKARCELHNQTMTITTFEEKAA